MPQIDIKIHVVLQQFEDDNPCRLGESLFFTDVSCLDHVTDEVKNLVAENVLSLLSRVPNDGLSQCILAGGGWRRNDAAAPRTRSATLLADDV